MKLPTKKRMTKRLDIAVGKYIKERSGQTCDICGIHKDSTPQGTLDLSHYISRRYLMIRHYEPNLLSSCRKCHTKYGDGFNQEMMDTINRLYGEGTTDRLERIANQFSTTKGTLYDLVESRLQLEEHYKQKLKLLDEMPGKEVMKLIFEDFGQGKLNEI